MEHRKSDKATNTEWSRTSSSSSSGSKESINMKLVAEQLSKNQPYSEVMFCEDLIYPDEISLRPTEVTTDDESYINAGSVKTLDSIEEEAFDSGLVYTSSPKKKVGEYEEMYEKFNCPRCGHKPEKHNRDDHIVELTKESIAEVSATGDGQQRSKKDILQWIVDLDSYNKAGAQQKGLKFFPYNPGLGKFSWESELNERGTESDAGTESDEVFLPQKNDDKCSSKSRCFKERIHQGTSTNPSKSHPKVAPTTYTLNDSSLTAATDKSLNISTTVDQSNMLNVPINWEDVSISWMSGTTDSSPTSGYTEEVDKTWEYEKDIAKLIQDLDVTLKFQEIEDQKQTEQISCQQEGNTDTTVKPSLDETVQDKNNYSSSKSHNPENPGISSSRSSSCDIPEDRGIGSSLGTLSVAGLNTGSNPNLYSSQGTLSSSGKVEPAQPSPANIVTCTDASTQTPLSSETEDDPPNIQSKSNKKK
ncbi:hypothetical protein Ahia01_000858300 [Argonauta hians]